MREREGNERKVECERKGHEWLLALAAGDRSEAAWATWGKKTLALCVGRAHGELRVTVLVPR